MEIKKETVFVKSILNNPDKKELEELLNSINFSPKEKEIVNDFVFLRKTIKEISIERNLCTSQIAKIKSKIILKIYDYYKKKTKT